MFSMDMTKIIDFKRNSFDFTCNNLKVQLPGMPKPDFVTYLKEEKLDLIENKFSQDYLLGIGQTKEEFFRIRIDETKKLPS